jgi:hypothetical protein
MSKSVVASRKSAEPPQKNRHPHFHPALRDSHGSNSMRASWPEIGRFSKSFLIHDDSEPVQGWFDLV